MNARLDAVHATDRRGRHGLAAIVWKGRIPIRTPGKKDKPSHVAGLWKAD